MKIMLNVIWNKGSGKDFFYNCVKNRLLKEIENVVWKLRIQRFAFADLLKEEYISYFNELTRPLNDRLNSSPLTRETLEQYKEFHRENLQKWGDWRRKQDVNYFLNNILEQLWVFFNSVKDDESIMSIHTDCRFKNEYDKMNEFAKQNWIKIINVRILWKKSGDNDLHISERELLEFPVDYELKNDYSPNFIEKIKKFFKEKVIPLFKS